MIENTSLTFTKLMIFFSVSNHLLHEGDVMQISDNILKEFSGVNQKDNTQLSFLPIELLDCSG